jgi:hypothetical protein
VAPRGHKLIGACFMQTSPGLLPAWLGDPGNIKPIFLMLVCTFSLTFAEFKALLKKIIIMHDMLKEMGENRKQMSNLFFKRLKDKV